MSTAADPEPSEAQRIRILAEDAKKEANAHFKAHEFNQAVDGYSKAIDLDPSNAVYFANRAFAHIKLENYGSAITDATQAIEIDPNYVKGYYRRGDAEFLRLKFKDAIKDFRTAAKVAPRDPDLRKKLLACEKEVKRIRFEEAIAGSEADQVVVAETVVLEDIAVDDSYAGARLSGDDAVGWSITPEFVTEMVAGFKDQKLLHKKFATWIVLDNYRQWKELPSLVDIPVAADRHITVCGDVHGQFYDLLHIFSVNGPPSADNPYLFNGDFVDRGSFSVEVMLTLMAYRSLDPSCMYLTRGNHESHAMNKMYGFEGEVKAKYNAQLNDMFRETFNWLPLAYCLNAKVLVLHGGLFAKDGVTLDDIRAVDRNREPPDEGIMCEALWSDPQPEMGRGVSKRGVGVSFGPDVTKAFLQDNNLDLIVRSHEVKDDGYEVDHDGYLITIFSAPNYCDSMGNKGAFIRFQGDDMVPRFTQFQAQAHPDVKPMQYASSFLNFM